MLEYNYTPSKLTLGNVVVMSVMPKLKTGASSSALVCGVVSGLSGSNVILSNRYICVLGTNYAPIQSLRYTDNEYSRITFVADSIEKSVDKATENKVHIGDLVQVFRVESKVENMGVRFAYLGFVNQNNLDKIVLTNYHPDLRKPWSKKREFEFNVNDEHQIKILEPYTKFESKLFLV